MIIELADHILDAFNMSLQLANSQNRHFKKKTRKTLKKREIWENVFEVSMKHKHMLVQFAVVFVR